MRDILVRQYKDAKAFQRDAVRQGARGYEIIEVNGQQQRVAIGRTAMASFFTGGASFFIGGRAHTGAKVMATYRYAGQEFAQTRRRMYLHSQVLPLAGIIAFFAVLAMYILH